MRVMKFLGLAIALAVSSLPAQEHPAADLVILHGKVWTVDPALPRAAAIAVVGDTIAAVGSDTEIRHWIGPKTREIDARGRSVLPGFIDAHVHFLWGGSDLESVQLRDARTPEEFTRRIGEFAKGLPAGEWIRNGGWDHELWGGENPARQWIDKVTPDNPVLITRYDGHMALANSVALKRAGITRDTPIPPGGEIVKDAEGNPTGLLKDAAAGLVERVIPPPSEAQLVRWIRAAMAEARRFGVTSVDDISLGEDVRIYRDLLARGDLTLRIYCLTPLPEWKKGSGPAGLSGGEDKWLRTVALKAYADGSLGSTTALFFDPYTDAPGTSGLLDEMFSAGKALRMVEDADRAGLQIAIHAIGDKANRTTLDLCDQMAKDDGPRDRRFRIEHAQHVRPQDFADFARLRVIASVEPYHAIDDGRWAEKRIGRERCKTTYAFRTFLDHGVRLAFGTDWTVAPLNPMLTLCAAVTRQTLDGKHPEGWFPEQKLTLAEAIEAYTMGSAYAEFSEKQKGSIRPGKLADFVVLDTDLFSVQPESVKDAKVVNTIVGGKVVFTAGGKINE